MNNYSQVLATNTRQITQMEREARTLSFSLSVAVYRFHPVKSFVL